MSEGQRGLLRMHVERHSGAVPVLQGYGRPSFLTHAHSRVFPLSVLSHSKAEELPVKLTQQRGNYRPRQRPISVHSLNQSIDRAGAAEIPKVEYRRYRAMHLKRQNSTIPSSREDSEYSNSVSNLPASQRLYQPWVIRLSTRSRLVLHSAATVSKYY